MGSEQEQAVPDVNNSQDYIENRAMILDRMYKDHLAWDEALAKTGQTGIFRSWTDEDGTKRTTVIDRPYLETHWRIIRSLIMDLADCGSEGQKVLRRMVIIKPGEAD